MGFKSEIEALLKSVDEDFSPPLSRRFSISEYAEKITNKSTIFSNHQDGKLIGFISVYCNDISNLTAYMTMLVISPNHRNTGLASNLVASCIVFLRKIGFKFLKLEAYSNNYKAISFYSKLGFVKRLETDASVFMELRLDQDPPSIHHNVPYDVDKSCL